MFKFIRSTNLIRTTTSITTATTFAILLMLLVSSLFPTIAIARRPAEPSAPLDVPATIVNESATEWVIHDGVIYWSKHCFPITLQNDRLNAPSAPNEDATLKRMPIGGGAITTLGTDVDNCLNFSSIAADDSGVYFYDGIGKIKVIRTLGPTPVLTDVTTASSVTRIRLDDTFVYFYTSSANIFRVPKTGGTAQALQTTGFEMRDFIVNAQSIYWFDNLGLWWGPKSCPTLPCSKIALSLGSNGNYMSFGRIGEAGGNPSSIVFVSSSGSPSFLSSIIELTCNTVPVCQRQDYYNAAPNWFIGQFRFVSLARSGPFPILDTYLFWTERDSTTGRLLRRIASATATTPSELYPGDATLSSLLAVDETNPQGVYFSDSSKIMFLPFSASAITRDLAVAGMEVTQAIQNMANQISLVADKTTYVRTYGKQNTGPQAGSVEMVLHGTRNGNPLPGSPLQPVYGNVSLNTSFVFDRAKAYDSWTFRLPSSWIGSGTIALRAEIDPRSRYEDTVPGNDTLSINAVFGREPKACLFFSPVRTHNPIPNIGDPNFWETMDRFARVWPVPAVEVHSMGEPIEELQVCSWHGIPYPCFGPYELDQASDFPSNFPSDKDRVIGKLMLRQALARAATIPPINYCQSGASVHSVGLVHPEADTTDDSNRTLLGYANYYINASFYKMEPFDSQPGNPNWYWPKAASVLAQEVTHNFNRRHVACGTNDATDSNWPYANKCQLNDGGATNYFGYDTKSRLPIPPQIASDFMSYKPSHSDAPLWQGQWVSDYTYNAVKGKFGLQARSTLAEPSGPVGLARPALPEAGEMVYAIGAIDPISNLGHLDYTYAQPLATMNAQARSVWQEFSTPSWRGAAGIRAVEAVTYHLRLKDASGVVLDDRAVTLFEADSHDGDAAAWPFLVTFPAPSGNVTRIELLADNTVLDTLNMGVNPPAVSILSPKTGATISDTLVIQWLGSDPDLQDVLHYNVQYSTDNGISWLSLAEDYPGTPGAGVETLGVQNPLALPGTNGATARIRVIASDGYHTVGALSDAFSVAQRAPVAHITSPDAVLSYEPNDDISLQGGAIDAESGVLTGTALSWAVSGVSAGTGEESSVRGLKPGAHTVVLTATDTTSKTGIAQTALYINPLVADEIGTSPLLNGLCDEAAYGAGTRQIQLAPYADGAQATARLLVNSNKLWLCLTGLARGSNAQVGRVGLFADVNNSQDASSQADDMGFFVAEDGVAIALLGNGAAGNSAALDARVTATGTLWTAEMSIDLASLGGSGHVIGARLSHSAVESASDSVAWPYRAQENQPNSWGQLVLGNWAVLDLISPVSATVGSTDVLMTLTGSNFLSTTVALFDGVALNTTMISATQMSALVPAAKLITAGTAKIQVAGAGLLSAPSPAAGLSFQIVNLAPTITALSPDTTTDVGGSISMTVSGSNFAPGALILFEGTALPTTVLSASQVRAQISTAQLQSGRVVQVAVQNAAPSGGLSNELPFLVTSPRVVFVPIMRK